MFRSLSFTLTRNPITKSLILSNSLKQCNHRLTLHHIPIRNLFFSKKPEPPKTLATIVSEGYTKEILKYGDNKTFPKAGSQVVVHYEAWFAQTGRKFDSTIERRMPFVFVVGKERVIKGWDEAVIQMSLGEKSRLIVKPSHGYGKEGVKSGRGGGIPPNATLIYEIEVLEIREPRG